MLSSQLVCAEVVVFLKVSESDSFYNSRVGGWETSLTAQRFDPPALKIPPPGVRIKI